MSDLRIPSMRSTRSASFLRALCVVAGSVLTAGNTEAQAPQSTPPRWKGSVDLTIGGENAAEGADFGRISGLATDATGRIFVADAQDNQVRVFSATGAPLGRIGRVGSGPLEFKRLRTIAIGPDRLLWARDEGNARMLAIDVAKLPASPVKTVPLKQFTGGSQLPIVFAAPGEVVDESTWFDPAMKTFRPLRLRLGPNGDVLRVDTLPVPPGAFAGMHRIVKEQKDAAGKVVGMSENYYWQPYGPAWLRAYGPAGVRADAVGSRYEVSVFGANGQLLRTLKRTVPPVALSARERQRGDSSINEVKQDLPFGVPSAKPPIVALRWSQDGQLWIERSTADGQPREADVYDASGRWIAIAEWPRPLDLLRSFSVLTGRSAIVVNPDANDLERVLRLTFR